MYALVSLQINSYNRNALYKEENYLDVIVISTIVRFETRYAH
jgi:hypothetical protein